uniref:BLUF domain-containing protein n=1 Tax=Graphocephala atropunctata TaxID=36148 RepID=A0A1B6KN98_9HEMI
MELPNFSLLDILIENLKRVGRKSYLHRVVYVFDFYKLNIDGQEVSLQEVLHSMIATVSEGSDEHLTGLLLLYDKYGVNMIEGSEESIFRHFQELADSPVISQCVPRIKILLSATHIAQRILNRWTIFSAQPQTLLEKLDVSSVEETSRRIKLIVVKLYNLWNYLRFHSVGMSRLIMGEHLSDRMTTNLPEFARLEFVLSTPALKNLRDFVETHRTVQQPRLYQELVWPPQKEFIPFNIFRAKKEIQE